MNILEKHRAEHIGEEGEEEAGMEEEGVEMEEDMEETDLNNGLHKVYNICISIYNFLRFSSICSGLTCCVFQDSELKDEFMDSFEER